MRVIQELVAYFDRRGRLTPAQLDHLIEQGLLAQDAPQTMIEHCQAVGHTWYFRLCGQPDGPLWGTDVYTGDSTLAAAAVHAGVLKAGQTAIVRVVVVEPPERFEGTARHGVTSHDFERYGTAFRFQPPLAPGRAHSTSHDTQAK